MSLLKLIPQEFDYNKYVKENKIFDLFIKDNESIDASKKTIYPTNFSVDPSNKIPYPAELDDLSRLHYIVKSRKVLTILEFGVGKSTIIFGDSIRSNKKKYFDKTFKELRRKEQYQVFSIDNNQSWIDECKKNIPKDLRTNGFINLHQSDLITGEFKDKICTYYSSIPNICPDLIYLDGPDQFSAKGEVRGLSTKHQDRMPMAADILSFEHFLQPGTLIIVDGRTANARFLKTNLDRNWFHVYEREWDQHFFELQETPLGIYNERMIDHCLGEEFYKRIK